MNDTRREIKDQTQSAFFLTCRGVKATLELVPEERSLTVDLPPYVMLCFCSVRWRVKRGETGVTSPKRLIDDVRREKGEKLYLQGFRDPGLGGVVDLSLPDAPAAALPQLTQAEAQILLVGVIFNLQQRIRQSVKPSLNILTLRVRTPRSCTDLCESHPVGMFPDLRQPETLLHLSVPSGDKDEARYAFPLLKQP